MTMDEDNELVYLARYDNNQGAWKALYDKYYHSLYLASLNYLKHFKYHDVFNGEEVQTVCYINFVYAINRYDLHNRKYCFKQALFQINRSQLHNEILKYFTNNGNKVLNVSYSYDQSNESYAILESSNNYEPEKQINEKIQFEEIKTIAKKYLKTLRHHDQSVLNAYMEGNKVSEIVKKFKLKRTYVQSLINSLVDKLSRLYQQK